MNWVEACRDRQLADLPCKIELDKMGKIIMSPEEASCSVAPEICIEILSPTNPPAEMLGAPEHPGKRELYFGAGALEFWMCDEAGNVTFYDPAGQLPKSKLCPSFPNKV